MKDKMKETTTAPRDNEDCHLNVRERGSHRDIFTSVRFLSGGAIHFEVEEIGSAIDDFYESTSYSEVTHFKVGSMARMGFLAHFLDGDVPKGEPERRARLIEVLRERLEGSYIEALLNEAGVSPGLARF